METNGGLLPRGIVLRGKEGRYLTDGRARVLAEEKGIPTLAINSCGKGCGIYLSSYSYTLENTRMLLNLILYGCKEPLEQMYLTDNAHTECAYFPKGQYLVVMNNGGSPERCSVRTEKGIYKFKLEPYETQMGQL